MTRMMRARKIRGNGGNGDARADEGEPGGKGKG